MRDPYEVLGIQRGASEDEIQKRLTVPSASAGTLT
mgnify:CR=1 FL=1